MSSDLPVPETKVLAIASHVVYGHVGNTMAAFVMQSLGCDVSAINTVQFSNHTGYRQWTGTKTTASEIKSLYAGLQQSHLTDFDVLLSGYVPGCEAVQAVGSIARGLKLQTATKPGSFFWVLDPVMGDGGKLYVAEDVVPVYRGLLPEADLVLPNQFEAETLSGVRVTGPASLREVVARLHREFRVPHVLMTSVRVPTPGRRDGLTLVGSTRRSDGGSRIFRIDFPLLDCFFSGTGDMFAALMVARFREACQGAGLLKKANWASGDEVQPTELPLAKAAERVVGAMHLVLERTMADRERVLREEGLWEAEDGEDQEEEEEEEKRKYLLRTKAAEVRVVRNVDVLREGKVTWKAAEFSEEGEQWSSSAFEQPGGNPMAKVGME